MSWESLSSFCNDLVRIREKTDHTIALLPRRGEGPTVTLSPRLLHPSLPPTYSTVVVGDLLPSLAGVASCVAAVAGVAVAGAECCGPLLSHDRIGRRGNGLPHDSGAGGSQSRDSQSQIVTN